MTTDDEVKSENTLVNVRSPREMYQCENCTFSDSDIVKFHSCCMIKNPLTPLTWTENILDCLDTQTHSLDKLYTQPDSLDIQTECLEIQIDRPWGYRVCRLNTQRNRQSHRYFQTKTDTNFLSILKKQGG